MNTDVKEKRTQMKAEIIAVGTELLMGQVENTNATFLADRLATMGIEVYYQSVVGDNKERLVELLKLADSRSELIVLCGGLGPTEDDLTKDVLANYLDRSLIQDQEGYAQLVHHFEAIQRTMTENNLRQSLTIDGGIVLPNRTGLAVGTFYKSEKHMYILLPGPPREMKPMFDEQVVPLLTSYLPMNEQLISRVLRFYGIGESQLVTELADLIDAQTNPTIAPYAKPSEVTLRLTVKTTNEKEGNQMLDELERTIQQRVGHYFYGYGEHNSLEQVVVDLLKQNNQTITAIESLTAGEFQSTIASINGASQVFSGGLVTYSLDTKASLLSIDSERLRENGTVSAFCAQEMATQGQKLLDTDYAISFTGVAGPDNLEGQAVGTVWISLALPTKESKTTCYHFSGTRNKIRHDAVMRGLDMVRRAIINKK